MKIAHCSVTNDILRVESGGGLKSLASVVIRKDLRKTIQKMYVQVIMHQSSVRRFKAKEGV